MKIEGTDIDFIVIGENVHCTRVLLRKGKRIGETPDGEEAILFPEDRYLVLPESLKKTNDYVEGRVKHVGVAVRAAMAGDDQTAMDYLRYVVQRQVDGGVDFLDLNVDEISIKPEEQIAAMQWLVRTVQGMTDVPLSIDSSLIETIEAGLEAYDGDKSRPLLNSASLERIDALDLAVRHNAHVIITAAGERGMPEGSEQRIDHASQMIDAALEKGIAIGDIQADLLVFPIAVDSAYGMHFLDAVRAIREKYGPDIHITGGMSNVSFGIPCRRLVNETFIQLAIEAGADGGIVDPVTSGVATIASLDQSSRGYELASQLLLGQDRSCKAFLRAYRKGELEGA